MKLDFEMYIVPKLIVNNSESASVARVRDEMKAEIAREYERTIYIMQFLVCEEADIDKRVDGNEYGISREQLKGMLNDYYH